MSSRPRIAWILLVACATLLAIPSASAVLSGGPGHAPATAARATSAPAAAGAAVTTDRAAAVLNSIRSHHVPMTDVFLPNFHGSPSVSGGVVQPLYTTAPAPMGLGYFGVRDVAGKNVGSISYYRSIEGSATLNSVHPFYLQSSSPDIFTMQLNTVLTHVTVFGNSSGTYWIQNVPIYYANSQTLGIEDNIWNFSAPGAGMPTTTLSNYDGQVVAPTFYYAVGPSWHMPTPFTIRLFNNATVENNRPTIFFNYSITTSNGSIISGSFDRVEFNSSGTAHARHAAPMPSFQVNGRQYNAFGLLNDAEIMLGGPGGGSTTTLLGIDGSMGLDLLANGTSRYASVPAGSSFGTDTGETSEGIAEWATAGPNPVAMLGSGPSLLQPLWGLVGAHSGFIHATFTVSPSNAFAFASVGAGFRAGTAAWAPVPTSGIASYRLTPGTYSFKFLLSDYRPVTTTVIGTSSTTIALAGDSRMGIYTPLWASDNTQLAAISQPGGLGTVTHPFVLDHNTVGPVDPLFGEFNDYFYTVFPGVLLADTNAYVQVTGSNAFPIAYSLPYEAGFVNQFGMPASNNLQLEFYNTTHVALWNVPQITGWFNSVDSFTANVEFWGSSEALIGNNNFQVQSIALVLFGGTNNTVWGNTFTPATTTAVNAGSILASRFQNALQIYESGDLVYNNAFLTPVTAVTPGFNFYTGAPASWSDTWNISSHPAKFVRMVDGDKLTGSILGLPYQSGNYWANYGTQADPYGVLPYNDGGGITSAGDFAPLLGFALYSVTFTERGLTAGTSWSVTLNGITATSNSTTITLWDPNGTYGFTVGHVAGRHVSPSVGGVQVKGANLTVGVRYS
ncbi:MAG TPA: thermopsin family protease [Thermoplasmata archaeon]|nr:thermopsin family protease [Thermoplasmata archaeon]